MFRNSGMEVRMERKVILVVEDNADELLIYTTLLSYHGYAVLAATDFDSALRIATGNRPDLAIVDVNLGERSRDGCELVAALREDDDTRAMPIIAHTAYGDIYRRSLQHSGCDVVVHKPSNPHTLLDSVREIIGQP
jgi:CheY-like chemotaxis protein